MVSGLDETLSVPLGPLLATARCSWDLFLRSVSLSVCPKALLRSLEPGLDRRCVGGCGCFFNLARVQVLGGRCLTCSCVLDILSPELLDTCAFLVEFQNEV